MQLGEPAVWPGARRRGASAAERRRRRFEFRLADNLLELQDGVAAQDLPPRGLPFASTSTSPSDGLISAAPFRDRVVHHALCNVIEPVFERAFIADSLRQPGGKGTHRALDRAQAFARRYRYVLQCDVRQFFPSIDHALLRGHPGPQDPGCRT